MGGCALWSLFSGLCTGWDADPCLRAAPPSRTPTWGSQQGVEARLLPTRLPMLRNIASPFALRTALPVPVPVPVLVPVLLS